MVSVEEKPLQEGNAKSVYVVGGGAVIGDGKSFTENWTFEKSLEGRERGSHEVSRAFQAGSGSMPAGQGEGGQRG